MGKIALLFSGQGAQYPGMGRELAMVSNDAREVFAIADQLRPGTSKQCFEGTAEELKQTRNTQPSLYCVDLAAALALKEAGIKPDYLAGFSLGEIPALTFGGYLPLAEAFLFTMKRAEYMEESGRLNPGTMYAVLGLTADIVIEICQSGTGWYPVNFNEEKQTVVSCRAESQEAFPAAVLARGGKAIKLPVSGGFHSPMMDQAKERLEQELESLPYQNGSIPVYANVTAEPYNNKSQMFQQINSPVLWHQLIQNMHKAGVDRFVEVGPGKTLRNLVSKILPDAQVFNVENEGSLKETLEGLKC